MVRRSSGRAGVSYAPLSTAPIVNPIIRRELQLALPLVKGLINVVNRQ